MEKVTSVMTLLLQSIGALHLLLVSLAGLFMLIPGDEPEKTLKKVILFIEKFSRKKL